MPKISKVCCQGCGSPLGIDDATRYVTCNHCGSSLEVIHGESTTHTRLLEQLQNTTEQLTHQVKLLKLQNDLERLDREWDRFRETVLPRLSDGSFVEPSSTDWTAFGTTVIVIGAIAALTGFFPGAGEMRLFGLMTIAVGVGCLTRDNSSATDFHRTKERYLSRRDQLRDAIDYEVRAT